MNYLKSFFITIILLSTGTIFDAQNDYFAYTTQPQVEMPQPTGPIIETEQASVPETIIAKEEKTPLEEWNDHLSTLSENWNAANNLPSDSWKTKAFSLAKSVLEKNKSASESLKSDFLAAINQQTTQINQAIVDLIEEFNKVIAAKLSSLEIPITKEVIPAEAPQPVIATETPVESLPTSTETPAAPATSESGSAQTSETSGTTSEKQEENQSLKQWNDLITAMKAPKGNESEIKELIKNINNLVVELLSKGKKTEQDLQKEFYGALESLRLKRKFNESDIHNFDKAFALALSGTTTEEQFLNQLAAQQQQFEEKIYLQGLAAEQQMQQERDQKETEKKAKQEKAKEEAFEKKQKMTEAALLKSEKQTAETFARVQALEATVAAEKKKRELAEAEAQKTFAARITQPTTSAKKLAAEQKAAAEEGFFSKAIKMVKDTASSWLGYGSSATPAQAPTTLAELKEQEDKDIEELRRYLKSTQKNEDEQNTIISIWKELQKILRSAPQHLDQYSIELNKPWINHLEHIITELVISHNIITIDQACAKIKNALPSSTSLEDDYAAQIVQKIKMDLDHIAWQTSKQRQQEKEHQSLLTQKRQERKEQIMLAQQRIKDEEDRIEAEKKKQLIAVADYENGKKELNQLLAQLSQNTQATTEENHAHTTQAIKKSHALLQLAHIIPSKNKHAVSQKLKQKFTVALLDQQRFNDNKLNIHHHMDHFNNEINKIME